MKIIILTRDTDYQRYFVNKINAEFGVDALFLVTRQKVALKHYIHSIRTHWKNGGGSFLGVISHYLSSKKRARVLATFNHEESEKEYLRRKVLKHNYSELNYKGPTYKDCNVNSSYFHAKVTEIEPDIILVFGTPLVADSIINMAKIGAINLHWGLSPYYRGGRTTIWPIYNDEPEYIGVTIHHLSSKIDGGAIITQGRPILSEDESLYSLELKLTKLGTHLMVKTITYITEHKEIPGVKQDFSQGKLYLGRELSNTVLEDVKAKFDGNYFKECLPINEERYNKVILVQNV